MNFIHVGLDKFPSTFGFKVGKGFFPHKFNKPENYEYKGKIPDLEYFAPRSMKPEKREALMKWHKDQNSVWVFKDEFLKYCNMDVEILWKSMVEFRRIFLVLLGIDPLQYVMIASVCMAIF